MTSPRTPSPFAWRWGLVALIYYVTVCLAHLQFSLWLVRGRDTFLGRMAFADLVPAVAATTGLALLGWIVWQLRRSPRPWQTAGFWLLWLGCAVLIDQFLTFSTNEYAHYPQYAALAWLVARTLDAQRTRWVVGRVLFWTTLMGIGDELLQYLWITTSYSDYLDFNDFLTNLVAGAAGMLLYYGGAKLPARGQKRDKPVLSWGVAFGLVLAILAGLQSGWLAVTPTDKIPPGGFATTSDGTRRLYLQRGPEFYGGTQKGPRRGEYHVLAPLPGLLLLLLVGLAFLSYGRFPQSRPDAPAPKDPWARPDTP
jgi:hypothetical protein